MKKIATLTVVSILATASAITLSSFSTPKKPKKNAPVTAYTIALEGKQMVGANEEWTWSLTNTNPGNGDNGTLQDVSHWSMALPAAAEAALVSAEYSNDGSNWHSLPVEVERDPSIRACTTIDVLKFNVGTNGTAPVYYRATFNKKFYDNPYATSWIKTGGGRLGCNMFFFAGLSASERFD
jgi:hypothetical protein